MESGSASTGHSASTENTFSAAPCDQRASTWSRPLPGGESDELPQLWLRPSSMQAVRVKRRSKQQELRRLAEGTSHAIHTGPRAASPASAIDRASEPER